VEEGNKLAQEMGVAFMQVSLKNGRNVDEVFIHIARLIKRHQERVRQPGISLHMTYLTTHDEQKKRISNMHWAYYDQKVLDDKWQERDEFQDIAIAKERKAFEQVGYDSGTERRAGCCTSCVIA
jgi:hypothetical protein